MTEAVPVDDWHVAVVREVRRPMPRIVVVRLEVTDPTPRLPGQHFAIRLTAADGYAAARFYSVCSAPSDPWLELLIEEFDDGELSTWFARVAAPGDLLEVRGPIGGWFVWDGAEPALAVGGGTGVAPVIAMLRHAADLGAPERITAVAAARTLAELPYADELIAAGATVVLSQQDFDGRPAGRLTVGDLARLVVPDMFGYVCGSSGFAESASQLLAAAGVDVPRIRVQRFGFTE